jgi:hypothetical protein
MLKLSHEDDERRGGALMECRLSNKDGIEHTRKPACPALLFHAQSMT